MLDEVDILFNDEDFEPAFQSLMNSAPITAQYLFVTATLPVDIYNMLVEDFPDCEVVMGPSMHRTSPGLEEVDFFSFLIMHADFGIRARIVALVYFCYFTVHIYSKALMLRFSK